MRKTANILLLSGTVLIPLSVYFIIISNSKHPVPFFLLFGSLMVFFLGLSFLFFGKENKKRRRVALLLFIIGVSLYGLFFLGTWLHLAGTSVLFSLTTFFMAFTFLPLFTKNRVEKWQLYTRKKWHAYFLSVADLISASTLIIGYYFRKMHWPGGYFILVFGFVLLAIGVAGWNLLFSREIILRKEAEEKIAGAMQQLKLQHELLEEKNREILDSIRYARRIQRSLMTHERYIQAQLKKLQKP